jgi:CRP/FNR family transcriptional regulator, cyclic AMP receptor protein
VGRSTTSFEGLLGSVSADMSSRLFDGAARKAWCKGAVIFGYGDPGASLLLIDTGRAELSVVAVDGRRMVLGYAGQGEVVGEMAVLDGGPRSADVRAATAVTGRLVSHHDFRHFLLSNPEVAVALLASLSGKLRDANVMLEDRTLKDASGRLARCVVRLAEKFGRPAPSLGEGAVALPADLSQSDLADLAGVSRETVNRLVKRWTQAGFLTKAGSRLTLRDPDGLATAVEGSRD